MMENYTVNQADLERLTSMLQELNNPDGDLHVTLLVEPKIGPEGLVIEPGSVIARMIDILPGESRPWYENEYTSDVGLDVPQDTQQWEVGQQVGVMNARPPGDFTYEPGQHGEQVGGRLPGGGTSSGMDMHVQYHFIHLKTLTDRTAIEPATMEVGDPDPSDLDAPYVTPCPPDGAVITVRSDWGPVKVMVYISEDASPIPADSPFATGTYPDVVSAPDLAHLDHDWKGSITLRDSAFDIHTFDDALLDHSLTRAGDHQVSVSWRYDHSHQITDDNDPTPYQEHVTIRFLN